MIVMDENAIIPIETKQKRIRRKEEKLVLQNQIVSERLKGHSFQSISDRLNLSEPQLRRHYKEFFETKLKELLTEKRLLFSKLLYEFELSIDSANTFLEKAKGEEDSSKIGSWMKLRQDFLKDYNEFLTENGLFNGLLDTVEQEESDEPVVVLVNSFKKLLKDKFSEARKNALEEEKKETVEIQDKVQPVV